MSSINTIHYNVYSIVCKQTVVVAIVKSQSGSFYLIEVNVFTTVVAIDDRTSVIYI